MTATVGLMRTSPDGVYLMHKYESCRLTAYPDPATGGAPWTIGWGHTGRDVVPGMTITHAEADRMFEDRLAREFEPGVREALAGSPVSQKEFDALVCFAYNVGLANLRSSTLLKCFRAGDKKGAANQFLRWDKAAGKRMLGLYRRRVSERALFLGASAEQAYAEGQAVRALP